MVSKVMNDYTDLGKLQFDSYKFTAREHQVTAMLRDGFGYGVICEYLGLTGKHVSRYVHRCMKRNGLKSRNQLVRVYRQIEEQKEVIKVNEPTPQKQEVIAE